MEVSPYRFSLAVSSYSQKMGDVQPQVLKQVLASLGKDVEIVVRERTSGIEKGRATAVRSEVEHQAKPGV